MEAQGWAAEMSSTRCQRIGGSPQASERHVASWRRQEQGQRGMRPPQKLLWVIGVPKTAAVRIVTVDVKSPRYSVSKHAGPAWRAAGNKSECQ